MARVELNAIAQVQTFAANGPTGPATAIMIAVKIGDAASGEAFVSEIAERFKLYRTAAPPNTSMLLVSLVGALSADRFAARWRDVEKQDGVVWAYMSLMQVADVVQGAELGQELSKASLLSSGGTKPWWKFRRRR